MSLYQTTSRANQGNHPESSTLFSIEVLLPFLRSDADNVPQFPLRRIHPIQCSVDLAPKLIQRNRLPLILIDHAFSLELPIGKGSNSLRLSTILAHRITTHFNAVGIVDQPVEDAIRQRGIADLLVPARDGQLGREDG